MAKRLTTPPEQRQFITDNLHHLAAFAWEGFQGVGRGMVAVEVDVVQTEVEHNTRFPPFLAFTSAAALGRDGFPSAEAMRMVEAYDPKRQVVVLFFWADDAGQQRHAVYRVATDPTPSDTVYLGDVGQVKVRI